MVPEALKRETLGCTPPPRRDKLRRDKPRATDIFQYAAAARSPCFFDFFERPALKFLTPLPLSSSSPLPPSSEGIDLQRAITIMKSANNPTRNAKDFGGVCLEATPCLVRQAQVWTAIMELHLAASARSSTLSMIKTSRQNRHTRALLSRLRELRLTSLRMRDGICI